MTRIFSLRNKVNDLFARSNFFQKDVYDSQDSASADSADATKDVAAVGESYGIVDYSAKHPEEKEVYIPQGTEMVAVWFNPTTRDVRPIPRNIR